MRLLAARPRSTAEIRDRLERAGAAPADLGATLERLTRLGYLDDRALARRQAEILLQEGRMSVRAAILKLSARGIDPGICETEVAALGVSDRALATAALKKRFGSTPLDAARSARAYRFLAQRGFDPELIAELVPGAP